MKSLLRWASRGILLLMLAAVAAPFLIPLDPYLPALERHLSRLSGRYFTIDHLRLEMLPSPLLRADGISVWSAHADNGELFIQRMDIHPDLGQLLFEGRFAIRTLDLQGVAANQTFIRSLTKARRSDDTAEPPPLLAIETVTARAVTVRLDNRQMLGPYQLRLLPTADLGIRELEAARGDGSLRMKLTAENKGYELQVQAEHWTLPFHPALRFDKIAAHGKLTAQGLRLAKLDIQAYRGNLTGPLSISWRQGWQIQGHLQAAGLHMAPIIRLFQGSGFQGVFHGDLKVALRGPRFADLLQAPVVKGPFRISEGIIASQDEDRPLLVFDEFRARGELRRQGLETWDSRLLAYGGTVSGHTRLLWTPQWRFSAELEAAQLDSETLLAGFLDDKVIAGTFSAQARVQLRGKRFSELFVRPAISGDFKLRDGVLFRADLEKASTSLNGNSQGQTRFQKMKAAVRMAEGRIMVEDLKIVSNVLQAGGGFNIDASDRLKGGIDVGLHHTGLIASIPLTVSGNVSEPRLRPSGAALVGGMVGSGLLGPGIGTAVGIKAGDTMEKLNKFVRKLGGDRNQE
ncbi:MAG: AsmA-like C-terminal region-containing protein [Gammaproteobacteria bacterium]